MNKLLVGLFGMLAFVGVSFAATLNVDMGDGGCSDIAGTPYCTIQPAINAAVAGDTIEIADGTYLESLDITKELTLDGESEAGVIIDSSAIADYGIYINADGVTLQDFTLDGPDGNAAFSYGIKAEDLTDLTITNVTVKNSYKTEIDLHAVDNSTLTDVTVIGTVGVGAGVAMTDSNNVTIDGLTSTSNSWGGIAIYTAGTYFDMIAASDGVTILDHTHNEVVGLYTEEAAPGQVTNLDAPQYTCTVTSEDRPDFTYYFEDSADAEAFAAILIGAGDDPEGIVVDCNDDDDDGVLDGDDICGDTMADDTVPTVKHGTNRWIYDGDERITVSKGKGNGPKATFTLEDTLGCNCEQILDTISDATDAELEGHYKHGCSKSILEDFARDYEDGVIDGQLFIESLEVEADDADGTTTTAVLASDETYKITVEGTADAGDNITFDALCSESGNIPADTWTDLVSGYEGYGEMLLDLLVDGNSDLWGSTCTEDHMYMAMVNGADAMMNFTIYDVYYPNNVGNLDVEIVVPLY